MNPLAKRWVDALRSGSYKQAHGTLRDANEAFCCLGVLADLTGCEWDSVSLATWRDGSEKIAFLPDDILSDVGIDSEFETVLAGKNDSGYTFEEIADLIEEKVN